MKTRSELFSVFTTFCAEIKTQFNLPIHVLEYLSLPFRSYMAFNGILHQTLCPGTPQQNGVAERKNRYLIETGRTLLLHMHVLLQYWSDVVLTTCHLLSLMTRFLILFFFLGLTCILFLFVSLGVHALLTILLQVVISYPRFSSNVFFWIILAFRRGIVVTLLN